MTDQTNRAPGRSAMLVSLGLACLLASGSLVCVCGEEEDPPPTIEPGLKRRVDELIASYDPKGRDSVRTLLPEMIVSEGRDAVPYLAWRLEREQSADVADPSRGATSPVLLLVDVLGRHADPRATPALRKVLEDWDVVRREAALRSIARIPGVESYRILLERLSDECGDVASRAQDELAAIAGAEPGLDPGREALDAARRNPALRPGVAQLLVRIGDVSAADLVHDLLGDPEESLRMLGVQLLPKIEGDGSTVVLLDRLTRDESVGVRKEACTALGGLGSMDAIEPLIAVLEEEEDPGLRANAVWALQQITGQRLADDVERWRLWWDMHRPR